MVNAFFDTDDFFGLYNILFSQINQSSTDCPQNWTICLISAMNILTMSCFGGQVVNFDGYHKTCKP